MGRQSWASPTKLLPEVTPSVGLKEGPDLPVIHAKPHLLQDTNVQEEAYLLLPTPLSGKQGSLGKLAETLTLSFP